MLLLAFKIMFSSLVLFIAANRFGNLEIGKQLKYKECARTDSNNIYSKFYSEFILLSARLMDKDNKKLKHTPNYLVII